MSRISVVLFSLVLAACGGGSDSPERVVQPPDFFSASATIIEGRRAVINVPDSLSIMEISHTGEVAFVSYETDSTLAIVAPNFSRASNTSSSNATMVQGEVVIVYRDRAGVRYTENIALTFTQQPLSLPKQLNNVYPFAGSGDIYDDNFLDSNGVPMIYMDGEYRYIPTHIAAYAFRHQYDYFTRGEQTDFDKFMNATRWLKEQCIYTEYGFCSHRYDIDRDYYEVYGDWASGMAQGQALYPMLAAAYYTQDMSFVEVAYDTLSGFQYMASEKVVMSLRGDALWFEEYASETLDSGVLNGFIFAMAGLYSFKELMPEVELAKDLFNQGVMTLVQELPAYDMGFSSFYNVNYQSEKANQISAAMAGSIDGYHELHIFQLAWLYQVSDEPLFLAYAKLFANYDFGPNTQLQNDALKRKFIDISSSRPVVSTHGPEHLSNTNWTYGAYWFTAQANAEIRLTMNEDFMDSRNVDGMVFVFLDPGQIPDSVALLYPDVNGDLIEAGRASFTSDIVHYEQFQVAQFASTVVRLDTDITIPSQHIVLRFDNTDIIALRELNILYERNKLFDYILSLYRKW